MRRLALILHAHLPWVRAVEPWSATERWFHEAMWECYVPLLGWLESHRSAVTVSVSPPLAAMMRDEVLRTRLSAHLDAIDELNHRVAPSFELREHYAAKIQAARRAEGWLERFAALPHVTRMTTAVTHAFLPALAPVAGVHPQLELGRACVANTSALWLPECAFNADVDDALAALDVAFTIVDEHAITLASPRVDTAAALSPSGVAFIGRTREPCLKVWSPVHGYPGHPAYRDFYRDVGQDGHAPFERGTMTGLKYHRITGDAVKQIYEPGRAAEQVDEDVRDLLSHPAETAVLAFDAELFGHWWHEGVLFLDALERGARAANVELVSVAELAGSLPVATPAPSTWGRGGFSADWVNGRTARLWPELHRAHREMARAVERHRHLEGARGRALDRAIEATLMAEASDWLFMISHREHEHYALGRLRGHLAEARRMLDIAGGAQHTEDLTRTVTAGVDSATLRAAVTAPRPC